MCLVGLHIYYKMIHSPYNIKLNLIFTFIHDSYIKMNRINICIMMNYLRLRVSFIRKVGKLLQEYTVVQRRSYTVYLWSQEFQSLEVFNKLCIY